MKEIVNRQSEDTADTTLVNLIPSDGEGREIPIEIAQISVLIRTMIPTEENEEKNIPLPNVRAEILSKVIDFLYHYKIEPMTVITKVRYSFHKVFQTYKLN